MICDGDVIARQLFSGHVKPSGKIEVTAFVASASNGYGISLDRWSKAPERLFKTLAQKAAKRRTQNFKGFALFDAATLKSVRVKDLGEIRATSALTKRNPFHADILIPPNRDRSFYLQVAAEIREKAKARPLLYN
jgi:hypothetical protein